MKSQLPLLDYTLRLADDALILGHRLSEWCGHGPVLEQDIAITNIALDHLGRARSLYQYAAEQFNCLEQAEKENYFSSTSLQNILTDKKHINEDDLAYLRDGWDFRNALLVEQPNKDWAYTILRSFYYDVFNLFFYTGLQNSNNATLAAIAEKSLKEIAYHLRWSSEWVIRLGDGTNESRERTQNAANDMWMYTGELLRTGDTDEALVMDGTGTSLEAIKPSWNGRVQSVFNEATLVLPTGTWMQHGGREGKHTEHLGYILTELQFMQRAYPGMEW